MRRYVSSYGIGKMTEYLILANVLVYAVELLVQPKVAGGSILQLLSIHYLTPLLRTFSLVTPVVPACHYLPVQTCFEPWQLVTYMFLHGGLAHIAFNMFILWQFGTLLERVWGAKRFLVFYFVSGIGAGAFTALVSIFIGGGGTLNLGASGALMGLIVAVAMLFPNQVIYLYFAIPIKLKYFAIGLVVVSLFLQFSGVLPGIGHITHLGGLLVGFLFLKGEQWLGRRFA